MKLFAGCVALGLILSLPGSAPAKSKDKDPKTSQKVERSTAVSPQVTLTLCVLLWNHHCSRVGKERNQGNVERRRRHSIPADR